MNEDYELFLFSNNHEVIFYPIKSFEKLNVTYVCISSRKRYAIFFWNRIWKKKQFLILKFHERKKENTDRVHF